MKRWLHGWYRRAERSVLRRARKLWPHAKGVFLYTISLLLVWRFAPVMFGLGALVGLGFFLACAVALYSGAVLEQPGAVALIAAGYIVTAGVAGELVPAAYGSFVSESFVTAAVVGLMGALLYVHGAGLRRVTS